MGGRGRRRRGELGAEIGAGGQVLRMVRRLTDLWVARWGGWLD